MSRFLMTQQEARRRHLEAHQFCIGFGPVTGFGPLADETMMWLGVDPDAHPEARTALVEAMGEELLDLARQILAEHGIVTQPDPILTVPAGEGR